MTDAEKIADRLSDLERDILLGRCDGWGSWMFSAGSRLVSLGLGTKRAGSISFDTDLAGQVRSILLERTGDDQ